MGGGHCLISLCTDSVPGDRRDRQARGRGSVSGAPRGSVPPPSNSSGGLQDAQHLDLLCCARTNNTAVLSSCCIGSRTRLGISPIFERLMSRVPGKIETLHALPPVKLRIASRSRVVLLFRCESAGEPLGEEGLPVPPLPPSFLSSSGVAAQQTELHQSSPGWRRKRWSSRDCKDDKQTPGARTCTPECRAKVYHNIGGSAHVSHYSWQNHNLMPGISLLASVPTPDSIAPITRPRTPLC